MKRVAVVFGTRPEAIKLAPVVLALRKAADMAVEVWVTGQHREMLRQVLDVFGIEPDIDLEVMRPNQSLGQLTASLMEGLDRVLLSRAPGPSAPAAAGARIDLIVVQGDTTTAFCAGLAGFYHRVPVAHVEAGLRTGDMTAPWPEEANRQLLSRITNLHLAPTFRARNNLLAEGIIPDSIVVTGNTVVDALLLARHRAQHEVTAIPGLPPDWEARGASRPLVLITGHRRESFGTGFESICRSIATLAARFPETQFVYPVHLNPNVRQPVAAILHPARDQADNIHLIEPLTYLPFVRLLDAATLVLTDSGGIQEEAPSLAKPVLVMRETTERPEAVDAGTARLVGTDHDTIVSAVTRLLTDRDAYEAMARVANPFGDGHAAARCVEAFGNLLRGTRPLVQTEFHPEPA